MICLTLTFLTSCTQKNEKGKFSANSFEYFDTVSVITGYADNQEEFDEISKRVFEELGEYHRLYSIYHRFDGLENLCTVNDLHDGDHRTVTVDKRIIDLLLYAREVYDLTNGMVNVAMGSVLSLWHDYRTVGMDDPINAQTPPEEALKAAAEHTDIGNMIIDVDNSTVTLTDPEMKLDVGAIAKGYATEQIAKGLEKDGIHGYVLNFGGNVRVIGAKGDGQPWTVGIENPTGGDYLEYLSLTDSSVVTSGSYQRYYIVNGKRYHHIIDPTTLFPAEGFTSVSILCNDSGLADALSTALFCMSRDEGKALIESVPDSEAMWVTEDGDIITTSGWGSFSK